MSQTLRKFPHGLPLTVLADLEGISVTPSNRRQGVLRMTERTLAICKPDSVSAGRAGAILARLEEEGFRIRGLKKLRLAVDQKLRQDRYVSALQEARRIQMSILPKRALRRGFASLSPTRSAACRCRAASRHKDRTSRSCRRGWPGPPARHGARAAARRRGFPPAASSGRRRRSQDRPRSVPPGRANPGRGWPVHARGTGWSRPGSARSR
jgi:hypothetical protein